MFSPVIGGMLIPQTAYGSGVNQSVADNESLAVYAQGTWHATGKLDLTLGLRHTEDDRRNRIIQQSASATGAALPPGVYKTDYGKTNYSLIASYSITPDVMVYAKTATGYVAGGVMSGIPYDPEELTSYELGIKSQFLDNRLRVNAAGYYMDYEDAQAQLFIDGVQLFVNAAESTIQGLELEVEAIPLDGLTLSATLGITDFTNGKFVLGGVDMADDFRNIYTPKRAWRLSGQYDLPWSVFGATPFLRLDARHSSTAYALAQKSPDPVLDRLAVTKAHWILDARAGIASLPLGRTTANISMWAKNLLDKDDVVDFAPEVINRTGQFINSRTVGVDLAIEL